MSLGFAACREDGPAATGLVVISSCVSSLGFDSNTWNSSIDKVLVLCFRPFVVVAQFFRQAFWCAAPTFRVASGLTVSLVLLLEMRLLLCAVFTLTGLAFVEAKNRREYGDGATGACDGSQASGPSHSESTQQQELRD